MEEIKIESDFMLIRFQNDTNEIQKYDKHIAQGLIQFHFAIKGCGTFMFNQGNYTIDLNEEKSLLMYNPQKELPLNLALAPKTWIISVFVSIQKFHSLFSANTNHIPILSGE
ncbi:MAG: AraC family transcriptional regulator, partial [Flavobacterium sp.]|nr:AraC family transcriptional regulator [Flavobacterium sp.]